MRVLTGAAIEASVVARIMARVLAHAGEAATLEETVHETIYAEERRLAHGGHDDSPARVVDELDAYVHAAMIGWNDLG